MSIEMQRLLLKEIKEELSIEEKAKRYDEAIEKAGKIHNEHRIQPFDVMLKVFPELRESKDEKIRKKLIETIHLAYDCGFSLNKEQHDKYIAWIEKQGEQKPVTHKYNVGATIYYNSFGEIKSMVVANVIDTGDGNPMYEDADGNNVFEKDLILQMHVEEQESVEWSEEDKKYFNILVSLANNPSAEGMFDYHKINKTAFNNWLKSIHPQKQWKPSSQQICSVDYVIKEYESTKISLNKEAAKQLISLREQLKTLNK